MKTLHLHRKIIYLLLNALNWQNQDEARAVASGGACGARPSHLKSVPPHFTFGPPVVVYIQYCILKMWPPFWFLAPLFGSWPLLLLNPGDGPGRGTTNCLQSFGIFIMAQRICFKQVITS